MARPSYSHAENHARQMEDFMPGIGQPDRRYEQGARCICGCPRKDHDALDGDSIPCKGCNGCGAFEPASVVERRK